MTARQVRSQHQHLLGSGVWRSVLGCTEFTGADLDDAAAREVAAVSGCHVVAHQWTSPLGTSSVTEVPALPGHETGETHART